jgi:hypothetical protein
MRKQNWIYDLKAITADQGKDCESATHPSIHKEHLRLLPRSPSPSPIPPQAPAYPSKPTASPDPSPGQLPRHLASPAVRIRPITNTSVTVISPPPTPLTLAQNQTKKQTKREKNSLELPPRNLTLPARLTPVNLVRQPPLAVLVVQRHGRVLRPLHAELHLLPVVELPALGSCTESANIPGAGCTV